MRISLRRLGVASTALLAVTAVAAPAAQAATSGSSSAARGSTATVTTRLDHVAVAGTDNGVWLASSPGKWQNMGGKVLEAPIIVLGNQGEYVMGVGGDHNVWIRKTSGGSWGPLGPAGTNCAGASAKVSVDTFAVACRGGDGALWVGRVKEPTDGSLPKVPGFVSKGGILRTGVSMFDWADYSVDAPTAEFGYAVVGADGTPWARTDSEGWWQDQDTQCGDTFVVSEFFEAGACKDGASQALKTVQYTLDNPEADPVKIIPSKIVGRPAVSVDPDGEARYFVIGTDGGIWFASRHTDDTYTGFSPWGGQGRYGVTVANLSS